MQYQVCRLVLIKLDCELKHQKAGLQSLIGLVKACLKTGLGSSSNHEKKMQIRSPRYFCLSYQNKLS